MTKYELQEYQRIKRNIEFVEEQISRLKSSIESPKIQIISDMPKNPNTEDNTAKAVEKMSELQDKYFIMLGDLVDKQLEIEDAISELPYREQTLMRYRYIEGLTWEEVAVKMDYSYVHVVHRLHPQILNMIKNK